jgi:hypothetical protein
MNNYRITVPLEDQTATLQCFINMLGEQAFPFAMVTKPPLLTIKIKLDDQQVTLLKLTVPNSLIEKE